jgi:predicted enzyme related to lactoylglutathione lyase
MAVAISPIILFVRSFDECYAFYREKLGLKPISLDSPQREYAAFRVGDTVFALHGGYRGKVGEANIALHFAFKDLESEVKRLEANGVKFTRDIELMPWGEYQATFVDPDGNEIDMVQLARET